MKEIIQKLIDLLFPAPTPAPVLIKQRPGKERRRRNDCTS
jgi:hypothetical protein